MAQLVKNLPAMRETWVRSLGWEDSLEKGKATCSWPGKFHEMYTPWGCKESDTTEWLSFREHVEYNEISKPKPTKKKKKLKFEREAVYTFNIKKNYI